MRVLRAEREELLPEMQEGLGKEVLGLNCGNSKSILTVTWFGSGHCTNFQASLIILSFKSNAFFFADILFDCNALGQNRMTGNHREGN